MSTEETNLGYIRRTIKPALGTREVRRVRGPLLDNLYARLLKCGDLACGGKPFTEHRHVPDLRPDPASPGTGWQQAAGKLREAITRGALAPGDDLPSVSELARLQGLSQAPSSTRSLRSRTKGCWSSATAAPRRLLGTRQRTVTPRRGTGPPGRGRATITRCPAASSMSAAR